MRESLPVVLFLVIAMVRPACAAATFSVPDADLPEPLVLIAYGDMRFTDPKEIHASNPVVRQALAARVAAESPAAIFILSLIHI